MVGNSQTIDQIFEIIERNLGRWKALGIALLDVNLRVWGIRGEVSERVFRFYEKFSLCDMHPGDTISNNNTFMIKATDKIGVIVVMKDTHLAMLSAINLKGRINALSDLYELEKNVEIETSGDAEKYLMNAGLLFEKDAEIFLEQGVYETAADLMTMAGFYYLSAGMLKKAKKQAQKALRLCEEKEITNHHRTFALICKEACNNDVKKAEQYWKQIQNKYSERERNLVNNALKEVKKIHSLRN